MMTLNAIAQALVADGKGILAADETPHTLTRRLQKRGVESTAESRRNYREMFFTTPSIARFISGVILQDETIHQRSSTDAPLAELLTRQGILAGIKVDAGTVPMAGSPDETITEGLDGLAQRLNEYRKLGAAFAKWRAVISVSDILPTSGCIHANAYALARYAAICQQQGVLPIVEPEVLMEGSHSIDRCEAVTGDVLEAVFAALRDERVLLEDMLLKPNMVIAGKACSVQNSIDEVAVATVRCLRRHAPAAVPGIVFLSGGQDHILATLHLNAINQIDQPKPWKLTFSYGRALQDEALDAWKGSREHVSAGREAFYHRARCAGAAARGKYATAMEGEQEPADTIETRRQ
jgi:fructose-bisphosphate aldolase, class I